MKIEMATLDSLNQLQNLVLESQLYQKGFLEGNAFPNKEKFKVEIFEQVKNWIADTDKTYFVAAEDGKVIGYILLMLDGTVSKIGSLSDLYVIQDYRGRGIASKLVEAGEKWLKEKGMTEVILAVHKSNQTAIDFYHKIDYKDKEDEYLLMNKNL